MINNQLFQPEYIYRFSDERPMNIQSRNFPRRDIIRLHYHPSLEVNYFENTRGFVWINNREHRLEDVYCIILPPWTVHRYEIEPGDGNVSVVQLSLKHLEDWIRVNEIQAFFDDPECKPLLLHHRQREFAPALHEETRFAATAYLFEVLHTLKSRRDSDNHYEKINWLLSVLKYSESNLEKRITLDDAAKVAGMSRALFARQFHDHAGESYHQFLLQIRLERATDLLDSGASVTEAALASGFYDASHLTRNYVKLYGHTPGKRGNPG